MIPAYTIRDLERVSGVNRTTIHFYLGRGLLPRPQKTAASRSLYTDEHVKLLAKIAQLKEQGLPLSEIETELQPQLDQANEAGVDLGAQEYERLHNQILAVAAHEFATKGYKNAHVTTIMRKLGITATVYYTHFASKRRLLAECVKVLMDWSIDYVDQEQSKTEDPAERLLWNIFGHSRVFELGAAALAVIRVEGADDDAEFHNSIEAGLDVTVQHILADLDQEQHKYPHPSQLPGDLVALNLFGAYEHVAFRSRFDKEYSRKELLRGHLWLFLAAQAARNGEIDIDSRVARYDALIDRLSSAMPPLPPQLELKDGEPEPAGQRG